MPTRDGGQLHREGQPPDAVDDAGDRVLLRRAEPQIGADRAGPFHELRHGRVPGECLHRVPLLLPEPQRPAGRGQDSGARGRVQQPRDHLGAVAQLLDVVEDQQHAQAAEMAGQPGQALGAAVGRRGQRQ